MKRSSLVLSVVLMAASAALDAQEPPARIGFVDVERAIATIEEGKARLGELREWARPREEELARLGREIETLRSEMTARRGTVSDDALAEMNRRLVSRQRDFEDKQRIARRDFEERQGVVLKELGEKLTTVITQHADSNRYTAVFILKPNDLVYLANSADLTETIIKLFNEKYPFTAGKN